MGIFRSTNPTQFNEVDGIVIAERAPAPNIKGVASNIAVMVGQFQRGPVNTMKEVGSIGEFHEIYGKSSFSGNKQLKNKKFGRLRIIRAAAAAAVKAAKTFSSALTFTAKYAGVYGNSLQVKIENAGNDTQEVTSITCVADETDSLDGTYFLLEDEDGTVAFWIDTDDSGTVEPSHGADRSIEITTIVTDDTANTVATKVAAAINADSKFSAPAPDANIVLATNTAYQPMTAQAAGTSGFTVAESVAGVQGGIKITVRDNNTDAVIPDEVYDNVVMADITAATFADSQLVDVTVDDADVQPATVGFTALESGAEGTIDDTDYETAIAIAEASNAGNVLFLDSYNSVRNGYLKTHAAATQDKMVIVCGQESDSVATAIADVANYRDTAGRIIYAYPYVETTINGALEFTPPASWYASIISQTSPHIDPAAADNSQFLAGITDLKKNALSRADYIQLMNAGISAFEYQDGFGYKVKSGVVTQIANSSKVMVFRRRMADYLTNSAANFLINYQNKPNTEQNRREVKGAFLNFIQQQESLKILPRDAEVQTGEAKLVDTESLNTDNSIAAGFFRILWRQRIYSSMRFITVEAEIGESVVVTEQE